MVGKLMTNSAGGGRRWLSVGVGLFLGLAGALLLLAAVGRPAQGATLCVRPGGGDGCEATIQGAVASAAPGDTIQVAAGVYTENVIISKSVTVEGGWNADFSVRDLDAFSTTIRPANAMQSVVTIEDADPTFAGFVVTGGRGDLGGSHGGGLRVVDSSGGIYSNTIRDNRAYLLGGGVWIQRGSPVLAGNRIEENVSLGLGQFAYGGGVAVEDGRATLRDNVIAGNVVSGTTVVGGGVAIYGEAPVMLRGNEVLANGALALERGIGGGVGVESGGTFTLTANVVADNWVETTAGLLNADVHAGGGGVGLLGSGALQMVDNVIRTNTVSATAMVDPRAYGGGVFALGEGSLEMSGGRVEDNGSLGGDDASAWGGGMFQEEGRAALHGVTFSGNEARGGGGMFLINESLQMENSTVSGNQAEFGAGALLFYSNTNGSAVVQSSVFSGNVAGGHGGGLYQYAGTMTVTESTITGNVAEEGQGGGIYAFYIMEGNALTVARSTLAGNEAAVGAGLLSSVAVHVEESVLRGNVAGDFGGGMVTYRPSTVVDSAIVDNGSANYGAALYHVGTDVLTLQNVTVSGNEAGSAGAIVAAGNVDVVNGTVTENGPAGIFVDGGEVTVANTIIAANVGPNCNEALTTMGHNLEDADTCGLDLGMDDLILADPMLRPLADNGGATPTHAIPGDSPAVDAGDNNGCRVTDQWGRPRVDGDMDGTVTCDIGAYEFLASLAVNSTADRVDADANDGACDTGEMVDGEPECTLRAAVQTVNGWGGAETITVPAGVYALTLAGANEDAAATGDLDVNVSVALVGAGAEATIVDGGGLDRVFEMAPPALRARPAAVTEERMRIGIEGLTMRNGEADEGGGVRNSVLVRLRLVDVAVRENQASMFGGGVFNEGELELVRTAVSGNFGDDGGGMFTEGDSYTAIYSSTLGGNETAGSGGGINNQGELWLEASTLSGNDAATNGGGLYNNAGATLVNVTVSGNSADRGGGVRNGDTISLLNVTIAGNTAADPDDGSGLENDMDATLQNVLLAGNSPANCAGVGLTSLGHNLDGGDTCGFDAAGDLTNADALLEPLGDNGGAVETRAMAQESAAVDAGDDGACPAVDARGVARPADGDEDGAAVCDIGAFELRPGEGTAEVLLPVVMR